MIKALFLALVLLSMVSVAVSSDGHAAGMRIDGNGAP